MFVYGPYKGGLALLWWLEVKFFKLLFYFAIYTFKVGWYMYSRLFLALMLLLLFIGRGIDYLIRRCSKPLKKTYDRHTVETVLGFPYRQLRKWGLNWLTPFLSEIFIGYNIYDTEEDECEDDDEEEYTDETDRRYARGRAYIPYRYGNSECKGIEDSQYDEDERIDIDKMDGGTFEHFCADLLRVNGWTDVRVTPASGDHGIDITAEKDDIKWGFQCKRWGDTKVDAIAIGQTYKGKALYECDMVAVITTSTLTAQAEGEAKQLGIKVWGRGKIRQLMNKLENAEDYYLSA